MDCSIPWIEVGSEGENSGPWKRGNTATGLIKQVGVDGNYNCIVHIYLPRFFVKFRIWSHSTISDAEL